MTFARRLLRRVCVDPYCRERGVCPAGSRIANRRPPATPENGDAAMRRAIWHEHPHVANDLTIGERAADRLKQGFGSWPFLIILNAAIVAWILLQTFLGAQAFDPYPWLLLNIGLSWLAAQQGGALQIAANRGDRINSEVALRTEQNSAELIKVNSRQLVILQRLDTLAGLPDEIAALADVTRAVLAARQARDTTTASGTEPAQPTTKAGKHG